MLFAKGTSSLGEKALSFQVLLACRAVETLWVVIIIHCFYPSVPCFNWKSTSIAFGREHFIPILVTKWPAILQVKWIISKSSSTMSANEALWMKVLSNRIQAFILDSSSTFPTFRGQVWLPAKFAIQGSFLLYVANVNQWTMTIWCPAFEMLWTINFSTTRSNEWSSDLFVTHATYGNPRARLGQDTSASGWQKFLDQIDLFLLQLMVALQTNLLQSLKDHRMLALGPMELAPVLVQMKMMALV